jgi:tetratricopeptide (TPR) repeat protein
VAADPARKEEDKAVITDKVELQDTETIVDKEAELDVQDGAGAVESSHTGVELPEKQEDRSDGEPEEEKEALLEEQEKEQEPAVTEHEPAARVKEKEVEPAAQEHELTTEKKEKEHKTDAEQKKEQKPAIVEKKKEQEPAAGKEEKEQEFSSGEQVLEQKGTEADNKKKQETPIEDPEQEHKGKSSSLSKEIMENISELKKHKASLLNLLNIGSSDKESHGDSKPKKSSKKEKSKHKAGKKDKKKGSGDHANKSEEVSPDVSQPVDVPENKNYPNYEEEDPVVIKDFLTKLEESNPPPKKKLKKEEQEKLIEKFIQSDPQMQNVRSSKELAEKKDLSAHSVKFRDDIISENLANIMIKQGKHEKAIDIYKKLIWKFPQKKAYFATQIEELKKKLKK